MSERWLCLRLMDEVSSSVYCEVRTMNITKKTEGVYNLLRRITGEYEENDLLEYINK